MEEEKKRQKTERKGGGARLFNDDGNWDGCALKCAGRARYRYPEKSSRPQTTEASVSSLPFVSSNSKPCCEKAPIFPFLLLSLLLLLLLQSLCCCSSSSFWSSLISMTFRVESLRRLLLYFCCFVRSDQELQRVGVFVLHSSFPR